MQHTAVACSMRARCHYCCLLGAHVSVVLKVGCRQTNRWVGLGIDLPKQSCTYNTCVQRQLRSTGHNISVDNVLMFTSMYYMASPHVVYTACA
jgi:hypothetical protein